MSRRIEPKASVIITPKEAELRRTDKGKLLLTSYKGKNCALLIRNDRLIEASFFPEEPSKIGAIYIGKVKSMVKNIDACFVEIAQGELCFLPLKKTSAFFLLNRSFDGRIVEGDEILVQVERDAQKTKRASVTAQVSLSNDYFVMEIGSDKICYSAKLSPKRKEKLKNLFAENAILDMERKECMTRKLGSFSIPPTGLIVRTKAGEEESAEEVLKQFHALAEQYVRLLSTAMHRNCFACLKEADRGMEALMQQFPEVKKYESEWEIVTDLDSLYAQLRQYQEENGLETAIRLYKDDMLSLTVLYSIESRMKDALDSRVWLKSGGYLVIEPTEALTVIDVNSGKYDAGRDAEETYRRINLEAAKEVALQMRLRNLSGIIIVDFINMRSEDDNAQLLALLKALVKQDKVTTTVIDMTPLGLVEITRKKISKPLREQFSGKI